MYRNFDVYAWKWSFFHKLGLVRVRNLSGLYSGRLISTFKDASGKHVERDVNILVHQTWTMIKVEMTVMSGSSSSISTSALGAVVNDGSAACLTYIYRNQVNPAIADSDMGDHDGAADLRVYDDGRMVGRYFNSRPRAGSN